MGAPPRLARTRVSIPATSRRDRRTRVQWRTRAQRRSRSPLHGWWRWLLGVFLLAGLLVGTVVMQLGRRLPALSLRSSLPASVVVPGVAPVMPWPAAGEAAVLVPALGAMASSPGSHAVPIASVTKMMTAFIILSDHPLKLGQQGPSVTITASDVAAYGNDLGLDESSVPVNVGESLTELQMLEALLIPSANNIANLLATWDAGTTAAFVAKMNATARQLGMRLTQYAGPSGYDPGSVSTPADQLLLAAAAMQDPVFAWIVDKATITLPVAGVVSNYNSMLGQDGIVGVKSGFTAQADGCLVVAATSVIGGTKGLVYAAVFGQLGMNPLGTAGAADGLLVNAARNAIVRYRVVSPGDPAGSVQGRWGGSLHSVGAFLTSGATVFAWPGEVVHLRSGPRKLVPGAQKDTPVGYAVVWLGSQQLAVGMRSDAKLPKPSVTWRLMRL